MARFAAENMGGLRLVEAQRGAKVKLGTYEGGPGYALNGLNGHKVTPEEDQAQERVMKSQASGVATLDSWLFLARNGFDLQNYFTFGEGPRWKSHSRWHTGGHAFPAWKLLGLWSREGRGEMLDVRTEAAPTRALKATGLRLDLPEAPQTAVYAAKDGDRLTVYLISRRLKGCGPFRVDLPIKGAASVTLHRMAGDPTDHNVYADDVKLERVELPVPANPAQLNVGPETGGKRCGMPPGSALVYIYDGVTW